NRSRDRPHCACASPDGTRIATGDWRGAKVWDARTGTLLLELATDFPDVASVTFSADGSRVATSIQLQSGYADSSYGVPLWGARARSTVWHSAPTGRRSSPAAGTGRRSGTHARLRPCDWRGTEPGWRTRRSARTGRGSSRPAVTKRRGSGTRGPGSRCWNCGG